MRSNLVVTILAAGEGKRMRSDIPKVLHLVGGKPMLLRVIETARELKPDKIVVVTGRHHKLIINTLSNYTDIFGILFVEQPEPNGTGDALKCCLHQFELYQRVLVLNADMPLINADLLSRFVSDNTVNAKVLTATIENPTGYGRILYESNHFVGIKEEKDATDEERKIKEINSGIYLFQTRFLRSFISKITNDNVQNEYYLTDIIKIGRDAEQNISTFLINENENLYIKGVNTPEELSEAELYLQK